MGSYTTECSGGGMYIFDSYCVLHLEQRDLCAQFLYSPSLYSGHLGLIFRKKLYFKKQMATAITRQNCTALNSILTAFTKKVL